MVEIGTGVFLILVGMGFGSLIVSHKFNPIFAILGAVSFFTISLLLFANYDVVSTTTYVDSTSQWNETNYLIGGENDDQNEIQPKIWLGWMFLIFGLMSVIVFFIELLKSGKGK